jgi:hypothetical protein
LVHALGDLTVAEDSYCNTNHWACSNASGGSGSLVAMTALANGMVSRGSTVPIPIQREQFTIVDEVLRLASANLRKEEESNFNFS